MVMQKDQGGVHTHPQKRHRRGALQQEATPPAKGRPLAANEPTAKHTVRAGL